MSERLYAKDLGVRKEIKEFIDVIKNIAKHMLGTLDVLLYL